MRLYLLTSLLFFYTNFLFSQNEKEAIESIKSHFKWVNRQNNFEIAELNNEDYLKNSPDNGGQLRGYFRNDTLYKIVEHFGSSYAMMITEYYFLNNELIFVYDVEKNYRQIIDSTDGFMGFDYSKLETKYESRFYFSKGKEIKKLETGKRLMNITARDFNTIVKTYKPLLKNKKEHQREYDLIQGKWTSMADSLSSMVFEGLTKVDYYEGKYLEHEKINIEGDYLYCFTQDDDTFKYEIMNLTDSHLTLLYLPVGRLLKYKKDK